MQAKSTSSKWLLLSGSIGPLGHLPASGTVTVAVVGIPLVWMMQEWLDWGPALYLSVVGVFTFLSVWMHQVGDRLLGEKDSSKLVWDELVGYFIAMACVPWSWQTVVLGFVLERAIDIVKVPPANHIERCWPGGWGVVGDDVVAGLYTCGILHLLLKFAPGLLGFS
jgi:phosphatidylglycerophosphatase A